MLSTNPPAPPGEISLPGVHRELGGARPSWGRIVLSALTVPGRWPPLASSRRASWQHTNPPAPPEGIFIP